MRIPLLLLLVVRHVSSCCCGQPGGQGVGQCPPQGGCCDNAECGTITCDGTCVMGIDDPSKCPGTKTPRRSRFRRKYTSFDAEGMRDKSSEKTLKVKEEEQMSTLMNKRAYGSTLNEISETSATGGGSNQEPDPYIMEFSILVCEGEKGCGSEGSMDKIDKFFEDQIGDWSEPEKLLKWEAASPRETADPSTEDLGTPRVPTVLSKKKVSDIVEFFSEYLDVTEDLVFVRDYSKTINPDNGMVRLPLAVWLNGQDELIEANKLLRKLHDDPSELREELGATIPHGSNETWVWVDAWCPPAGGPADTPIGCQSLDLSDIKSAEDAVKIAGLGEPKQDFPRYPEKHDVEELGMPFSMIVRAGDQRVVEGLS